MPAVRSKLYVLALATAMLGSSRLLGAMQFSNQGRYSDRLIREHLDSAIKLFEAAKLVVKPEFRGWSFQEIGESNEKISCGRDGTIRYHGRPSNQRIVFALSFCGYLDDPTADTFVVLPWYITLGKERLGFILEPDVDIYRKGVKRIQEVALYLKKRQIAMGRKVVFVTDEDVDFHVSRDRLIVPWNVPETALLQLLLLSMKHPSLSLQSDTTGGIKNWNSVEMRFLELNKASYDSSNDKIIFTNKESSLLQAGSIIFNISDR